MFKKQLLTILALIAILLIPINVRSSASLADRLEYRILLQVESRGEAWLITPQGTRIHMATPQDAWEILRKYSLGITNEDLLEILEEKLYAGSVPEITEPVIAPVIILEPTVSIPTIKEPIITEPIIQPPLNTNEEISMKSIQIIKLKTSKVYKANDYQVNPDGTLKEGSVEPTDQNSIVLGAVCRNDEGNATLRHNVHVTATDKNQNKMIKGTGKDTQGIGAVTKVDGKVVSYYPYKYEFKTVGTHVINFKCQGIEDNITIKNGEEIIW